MNIDNNSQHVGGHMIDEAKKNNRMLMITMLAVLAVIVIMAMIGFLLKPSSDTIQGQADATEIKVSGKLPGRVAELYVDEGDYVKTGDTLVKIHSSLMEAKLSQAVAMQEVASAADRKVDAGTRIQIVNSAYDLWQQAIAAKEIASKTYNRMESLFSKGVVSEQKRDEAKAAYKAATAGEQAAKNQYELAKAGAQKEDKQAAVAMVTAAKGAVNEVNAFMEDQFLTAPCDGEITQIYPNISELVATGAPIMSLQKEDYWAVFNVRETILKDISVGSDIMVRIPALDKEVKMKVFYIRDLGTYANWQATKSTGDYDARTFEIKARPKEKIKNFRPGMSVILVR